MLTFGEDITFLQNEGQYVGDSFRLIDEQLEDGGKEPIAISDTLEIVFDHVDFRYPEAPEGQYTTNYLWECVLNRRMLLCILQRYISLQEEERISIHKTMDGKIKQDKKKSVKIIFPRYHQLDVVEKLLADTAEHGSGKNYLIQHSAGSGKSNSIAWVAYRLGALQNAELKPMFNCVFVITDRRILNSQLQKTAER